MMTCLNFLEYLKRIMTTNKIIYEKELIELFRIFGIQQNKQVYEELTNLLKDLRILEDKIDISYKSS